MLAKIISALALTLLLTGGALAYIPQPDNINAGQNVFAENTVLSEPQPHNIIYTGHSNSVQPEQSLQTELFAANAVVFEQQPHNIYAGHSNSVLQAQVGLEIQLFAANPVLSEPRQFD
jgi:hypothetical protein